MIQPKIRLSIDGKAITSYTKIKLVQKINDHHEFEIILDNDVVEVIGGHTIDKSKNWLGKSLIITFDTTEFLGYITAINLENKDGHNGNLILKGHSPTILLEGGKNMSSWLNNTLEVIVGETLETLNVAVEVNPFYKEIIEYQVQYNENNYTFLQRLAKQYNEWFYYNGTQILFGKPERGEVTRIEYGSDISEIALEVKVKDHSQTKYSYNAETNSLVQSTSKDKVAGLNELSAHAFETSSELYTTQKNGFTTIDTKMKSQIDGLVERTQAASSAGLHVMKAKSTKQGITVGSIIKVESAKVDGQSTFDVQNYGEYMVTSITHQATERDEYYNIFEAIPSGVLIPEAPKVSVPKSDNQVAKVLSNEDPKGMGRVQVKFDWQIGAMKTSWLRVMTPDAGSSEHHGQNRGHVFVPEVGDQVMIGFEYNNPNRPFVMGGMYHGENGAGGGTDNNKKSIITRSGHVIQFDDTEKAESITITDKNKNIIFIDTANKNIKISAPETIDIEAKNINIRAEEKIFMQAQNMETQIGEDKIVGVGNNLEITAESSYTLNTTEHSENIEGSKTVDIKSSLNISSSEAEIIAENGDINIQGAGIATVQGGQDVKVSKG